MSSQIKEVSAKIETILPSSTNHDSTKYILIVEVTGTNETEIKSIEKEFLQMLLDRCNS